MSPSRTRPALPERQLRLAWQSSSLLLGYPDEELLARVPLLREAAGQLPPPVAGPLGTFLAYLGSTPLPVAAEAYVATFDHQKRCCPYLTWFVHGDTRNRGVALLRFKSTYRAAGMELDDGELPDHLAVLLEFGATADPAAAWDLLLQHRAGVELLRLALTDTGSAWSSVARAVCATLPPLGGDDREAVAALAAQGPPAEEVGLAPFAPPEYMPEPRRPVSLPLPAYAPAARGPRP
jgi:nitrate reductase molybdenum cofactor assembly chaperone NarJ/NarW